MPKTPGVCVLLLPIIFSPAATGQTVCTVAAAGAPPAYESRDQTIAADFDADGHLDVLGLASANAVISYGRGDGTFTSSQLLPSPISQTAVVADMNGDGRPDLIDIDFRAEPEIRLHASLGRGFAEPLTVHRPGQFFALRFAGDFNNDGRPDLVAQGAWDVHLLENRADGTFQERPAGSAESYAAGDLDHDGNLDLVVRLRNSAVLNLWRGDGTGRFIDAGVVWPGTFYVFPKAVDVDGDGRDDLAGIGDGTVYVQYGPIVTGTNPSWSAPALSATQVLPGDYNGDGAVDLAIRLWSAELRTFALAIHLSDGRGAFATRSELQIPADLLIASDDFDDDGRLDLAVKTGFRHFSVLFGRGDGTFAFDTMDAPPRTVLLGVFDLDNDGADELIAGGDTKVHVGRGGTFEELPADSHTATASRGSLLGDSNITAGDVHPTAGKELIVATGTTASAFGRAPAGLWTEVGSFDANLPVFALTSANLNESDSADEVVLAVGEMGNCRMQVRTMSGTLLFSSGATPCSAVDWTNLGRVGVHSADFDGDGHRDVLFTVSGTHTYIGSPYHGYMPLRTGQIQYFRGRGDGTFETPRTVAANEHFIDVSIGDLNGDMRPDLVVSSFWIGDDLWTGPNSIDVTVAYANGDGSFRHAPFLNASTDDVAHATGDLNGDGISDLVVRTDGVLTYYFGTRSGLIQGDRYSASTAIDSNQAPYIVRRRTSRLPAVVYTAGDGLIAVLENTPSNECASPRRRSSRK